jgi:hypothetical protein
MSDDIRPVVIDRDELEKKFREVFGESAFYIRVWPDGEITTGLTAGTAPGRSPFVLTTDTGGDALYDKLEQFVKDLREAGYTVSQ